MLLSLLPVVAIDYYTFSITKMIMLLLPLRAMMMPPYALAQCFRYALLPIFCLRVMRQRAFASVRRA